MAEAGDRGLPESEILNADPRMPEVYVPRRDSLRECMPPGETHPGNACPQKRHTLGVYVPRRDKPWECMFSEEAHLGSVCPQGKHSWGVYVPRRDTPRDYTFLEERHFKNVCARFRGHPGIIWDHLGPSGDRLGPF